jgi:hypothetical protein
VNRVDAAFFNDVVPATNKYALDNRRSLAIRQINSAAVCRAVDGQALDENAAHSSDVAADSIRERKRLKPMRHVFVSGSAQG